MNGPGERKLQVGHGLFDPLTGDLSLEGRTVKLRPRTAALLAYLVQHGDRAVGKDELMRTLWPDVVVTEDSIVQCVKEIRQALGNGGREWIRTLPRTGYAFVANHVAAQAQPAWRRFEPRWRWGAAIALAAALAGTLAWRFWPAPPPPPLSATIIVLPIANAAGDAAYDRMAEDLTEAITDMFGRGRFGVIAPSVARAYKDQPVDLRALGAQLKVRHVLQGSLRLDEAQPVLRLRLADAPSGVQLWQQDFKVNPGGPELRPDVVGGILETINEQLIRAEARQRGDAGAVKAAELVSRASDVLRGPGSPREKNAKVIPLLEEAVRFNENLVGVWAWLAGSYLWDVRYSAAREERLARAEAAIKRARKLLPNNDAVISWEANVYLEQARPAEALRLSERALELNPGDAVAMYTRGRSLIAMARPREALVQLEQAMRTSPRDPLIPAMRTMMGVAYLHLGNEAAAIDALLPVAVGTTLEATTRLFLAGAFGAAGRVEEARAEMAQFQQLRPGFTFSRFRATELSALPAYVEQRQRLYDGLRRAGMPE